MREEKICNHCGKVMDFFDIQQEFTLHKRVEYGSRYDGCHVNCQLCCACFDELVEQCVVTPVEEVVD